MLSILQKIIKILVGANGECFSNDRHPTCNMLHSVWHIIDITMTLYLQSTDSNIIYSSLKVKLTVEVVQILFSFYKAAKNLIWDIKFEQIISQVYL